MDYRTYPSKQSLGYKLGNASRLMINRVNRNFKENNFHITHEQWQIIIRLWEEDGQTQNKLAAQTQKDEPSVSRLINNMIKRNLVKRRPHPSDRRMRLIFLTEECREIQQGLITQVQKTLEEASREIDQKDMEICLSVLDQIAENLK